MEGEGMMMPERDPFDPRLKEKTIASKKSSGSGRGKLQRESVLEFMQRVTRDVGGMAWDRAQIYPQVMKFGANAELFPGILADVFWSLLVSSLDVERSILATPECQHITSLERANYFVVTHYSNSLLRHDLLVWIPEPIEKPVVIKQFFAKDNESIEKLLAQMRTRAEAHGRPQLGVISMLSLFSGKEQEATVEINGFIEETRPAIVVTSRPPICYHASFPSPAEPVAITSGASYSSSVGVVARDKYGNSGVTVAYHGLQVGNVPGYVGQTVNINGVQGTVQSIDCISDSAFVKLPNGTSHIAAKTFSYVRNTPAPGYGQNASFEGYARPGAKTTVVVATSPTLLIAHPAVQRQVLTNPDSLPSDSGCALLDDTDQLIGFCFGGSGTLSPLHFSMWIWADSVLQAHGLS